MMQSFTRRSARVEAMRLRGESDLVRAWSWGRRNGMRVDFYSYDGIRLTDQQGIPLVARIGQWLAHNPATGEVTAWNHDKFVQEHPEAQEAPCV